MKRQEAKSAVGVPYQVLKAIWSKLMAVQRGATAEKI
jgi:hypothetical protein